MEHTLPKISYEYGDLAPIIGKETMELHHSKHHQTYVDNLNKLIPGTEYENMTLEQIVQKAPAGGIFNNAAQHWNHCQFWEMIAPNGSNEPTGKLADAICALSGTFEDFKSQFETTGATTFGSGWAWLAQESDGTLCLMSCSNADNPLKHGKNTLLGVDVWEHAYYVDYRNRRPEYLKNFWKVVNWDNVSQRFNG